MLFKTDENLPSDLARLFRKNGLDCFTAGEQGLRGKPDEQLAQVCKAEGRILVSLDLGFANIRAYPPSDYPGFVVFRLATLDTPHLMAVAPRLVRTLKSEPLSNELWIVEDRRIRRRR